MVGGIGLIATWPAPWKTASMMAFLLMAMLSALRTRTSSNGLLGVVHQRADVEAFLLVDLEVGVSLEAGDIGRCR